MLGAMLALLAALHIAPTNPPKGSLYGMVVVIDPGHGGSDPGAHGNFAGGTVYENEYCYDVAVRLYNMVRRRGGIAVMTLRDPDRGYRPFDGSPQTPIPLDQDEVFGGNGKTVRAGSRGLAERVATANRILARYPKHRVVFISIHFDVTPNRELEGVHLIVPESGPLAVATALESEFRQSGRLRKLNGEERNPIVRSGDAAHGMRRLYILSAQNRVRHRVLVELGNFANERDVWRLRDHSVRQDYAGIMVRALEKTNSPTVRFR